MQSSISSFFVKNKDSNVFRISEENFDENSFLEYLGNQSLFGNKFLISADGIFRNKEASDFVLEKIKDISASPNIFIFLEENLKKEQLEILKENSEKVFIFDLSEADKENKKKGFNIFSICDALGEKDKKKLWIVFNQALKEDVSPEEIYWKLVWEVKNLLLAKIAVRKGERAIEKLEISSYVLKKSKQYAVKFTEEELENLYSSLVCLYHNARRGVEEFDLALESFILKL